MCDIKGIFKLLILACATLSFLFSLLRLLFRWRLNIYVQHCLGQCQQMKELQKQEDPSKKAAAGAFAQLQAFECLA